MKPSCEGDCGIFPRQEKIIELHGKVEKQEFHDHDIIVQVLELLVGNAFKFSSPDEKIEFHSNHMGSDLRAEIIDFGIGINPAE